MDSRQHIEITLRCGKVVCQARAMQRATDRLVLKLQWSALVAEVRELGAAVDAAAGQGESPVKSPNTPSAK